MLKVVAIRPNTLLSIPSRNKTIRMKDIGDVESVQLDKRDYSLYLHSNVPVKVFHLSLSAEKDLGDPSLLEVVPLHLQTNYYVFTLPDGGYRNFLHSVVLVVEESSRDGLRMNKGPLQTSRYAWHTVPSTYPVMLVASIQLHPGVYRVWHVDPLITFSASVLGISIRESYSLRAGSCTSDFISHSLPASVTAPATTNPPADTSHQVHIMRPTKHIQWPISTSKSRQLPFTTAQPVVWMSKRDPLVAASTTQMLFTDNATSKRQTQTTVRRAPAPVGRAPATVERAPATVERAPSTVERAPVTVRRAPVTVERTPVFVNRRPVISRVIPSTSMKALTTNDAASRAGVRRAPVMDVTSSPVTMTQATTRQGVTTISTRMVPSSSLTTSPTSTTRTSSSEAADPLTSAVGTVVAAVAETIIPNETYWLYLGLGEQDRHLSDEEREKIEITLKNLYLANNQTRLKRSDDSTPDVQAKVFLLETHGHYTAVIFYLLESGQPITAGEVLNHIQQKPVDELTHLLGLFVVKPITAYVDVQTTTAVLEAAILDEEEESGDDVTLIAALVGVVGLLVAVALTIGLTVRRKRKRAKQTAVKESNKEQQACPRTPRKAETNLTEGFNTPTVDEHGDGAAAADLASRPRESWVTFEQEDARAEGADGQEVKHGDGAQNTTATELLTDTAGVARGSVLDPLQPEYPMSLSTAELDSLFAPHVANAATRVEISKNKSLMRKKGQCRPSSKRKRASEPDVGYQNFIRRVSSDVHRRPSTQQEVQQPSVHRTDQSQRRSSVHRAASSNRALDIPDVRRNTELNEPDKVEEQVEVIDADVVGLNKEGHQDQTVVLDPSSHIVHPSTKSSVKMNFATRSEMFKNKTLMRHRGRFVAMGRRASEPEIGQKSFSQASPDIHRRRRRTTKEVEQLPVYSADQSAHEMSDSQCSGSYELPIATEESNDEAMDDVQGPSEVAVAYDVDEESETITCARSEKHSEGAVMSSTLAQMESTIDNGLLVKQAIADNKLRKYRLRQRYRDGPCKSSQASEREQGRHPSVAGHLLVESSSTNSLPGSVTIDSEQTLPYSDSKVCADWRRTLMDKSKKRQQRHLQEMTSHACLRAAGSGSTLT